MARSGGRRHAAPPTSRSPTPRHLRWKYPVALRDARGDFLNGSNTYKLHLPPDPPAALFWAVTAYNITDGTMVEGAAADAVDQRLQQGRDEQRRFG
jgi:hypothetical protein